MKRILLLFLILVPLVSAAQGTIVPVDFSNEEIQIYRLGDGDGILFYLNEKEYVISVDEIGKNSIRLKSFLYNEDVRETFYAILNWQFSYKFDFDKDGAYDLKVDLAGIEDKEALVLFEKINEQKGQDNMATGKVISSNFFDVRGIIITILIVIAGLIAYFIFRKR